MKLLVPTDFSKNAQKGVEFATNMAKKSGSEVVLLHAHQIINTDSASRRLLFEEYNLSVARKLNEELKVQKRKVAMANPGITVSAELYSNEVKSSIVDASETLGSDLIVMGTQGASGLKNFFMGSVTAKVIGRATVPVLAVPRLYKWKDPENILLATNNFETHPEILDTIFKLVDLFKANLHVIVFTDADSPEPEEYYKKSLDDYHKFLERIKKNIPITSAHLKGIEFEDAVQQYINDHSIDMLAMITYKRNFLENIFHRSATKNMAYRTRIPLLAIPASK